MDIQKLTAVSMNGIPNFEQHGETEHNPDPARRLVPQTRRTNALLLILPTPALPKK